MPASVNTICPRSLPTRPGPTHQAGEDQSLTQGTAGWAALGGTVPDSGVPNSGEGSEVLAWVPRPGRSRRRKPLSQRVFRPHPHCLEALLRRLRLPHIRRLAPEVIATAKAQRWEPAEVPRCAVR